MRTRKKSVTFLFLCLLLLCCVVPQCHLLGFTGLSLLGSGIGNAMTLTNALGMAMTHSMVQSIFTTFAHGFSMLNTMALSLISGFIMGNFALAAFVMFLMAIVPAEDARSIGGSSIFSRSLLPHYPSASIRQRSRVVSRHKRSFLVNASVPISVNISRDDHDNPFPLPRAALKQDPDSRIPRFFSRLVQRDPLNCMPLVMCGLSAAKKPNTRTETLNDYAYLMKEIISDAQEDRSDEDSGEDEDMMALRGRRRRPVKWREELVEGRLDAEPSFKHGKADKEKDVDDIIDDIQQNEDEQIEDLVLTEMANDPHDLPYALEDLKIRGLKKTMSKMPYESRQEYISKLLGESGEEDEDASVPMEMMGHRPRHEYPGDSSSVEDDEFYSQERIRGGFPPPPPTPPGPEYGSDEDELFKRNLRVLDKNLAGIHRGRLNTRGKRQLGVSQRGYLLQKRSQVNEAKDLYEKTRIGAEIGAATRSARQCRSLFRECPVKTIASPSSNSNTPFLNRAVNNIRKVLLGPQPENSKQKRVNEIKEVIQQLQPAAPNNRGGSEVRVVLNIGPTPPDPHRTGFDQGQIYPQQGLPGVQYQIHTSPTPQQSKSTLSNKPVPYQEATLGTTPAKPKTTANPPTQTTPKKALTYRHPGSSSSTLTKTAVKPLPTVSIPPSVELDSLEFMLRTTMAPDSLEDSTAQDLLFEESTDLPPNLYEGEEHSVEDMLPTKHPMTKDEYAASLRETFSIFNRFKEAHTNPKTTPTPTAKPKETPTRAPGVKKTAKKKKSPRPGGKGQKKHGGGGKLAGARPTVKNSGSKSGGGGGGGIENDINKIVGVIKNLWKTPTKRGKGKRKKKPGGGGDSSEESSEEEGKFHPHDYPHNVQTHTTLVAVPHPRVRNQIQFKSSSALITDGVYHLLFANRKTKPLVPDHPTHNSGSFEGPPHFGQQHHAPSHHPHAYPHRFRTESNEDDKPHPPQDSNEDDRPPPQYSYEDGRPPPQYSNEDGRPPPQYSNEDGEREPGPILMPGGVQFGGPPDRDDSMEENGSYSDEIDDVEPPTEPQLVFNPFAIASKPNKHRSSANKRKSKKGKKKVVKPKKVTTTTTTTTAKPTRRILKYKG